MMVEIGHFALILGLPVALVLAVLPLCGALRHRPVLMATARPLAAALWSLLMLAFIALSYAFLTDDFSVNLVAAHSNTALPSYFKWSAVWGNHEGSLLLWALILASWTLAVALLSAGLPDDIRAGVLSVLGMIAVGFLSFIIFTSNPFTSNLLNPPLDGQDLNPLLQDIGLILHPPMLYLGYVGFSVAFAFAIVALITGKLDTAWAKWSRPWTNTAWAFLTAGIALGSWWAYYELGWGGWWFWDPVENASFMPWLAGTALIHSLATTEKRGVFRSWTVLLAILAFSLSLLGTFLVRSGILVSVHAFAADPSRGLFILAFLVLVIGGSLLLYALRAPSIRPLSSFTLWSRETWLLLNNILLAVSLAVVLLGTLFPLIMSALDLGSYSVGPPYFNSLFLPLMLPTLLLMAFAPFLNWKRSKIKPLVLRAWYIIGLISLVVSVAVVLFVAATYALPFSILAYVGVAVAILLVAMTIYHLCLQIKKGASLGAGFRALSLSYWGMVLGHLGVAITAFGITLTAVYSVQKDVRMDVGSVVDLAGYRFELQSFDQLAASNYRATRAIVQVYDAAQTLKPLYQLLPEKRYYIVSQNVMTEAAIHPRLRRDIYVSLGDQLDDGAWAVRVQIKPFVRCIWLGALVMAIGGLLAVADKRYRKSVGRKAVAQ